MLSRALGQVSNRGMKRPFFFISLLATCAFAISPVQAGTRENRRLREGKITKVEAQHLVLREFPGAAIRKCELVPREDHSMWVVTLVKPGGGNAVSVRVDGRSGKILPPDKAPGHRRG